MSRALRLAKIIRTVGRYRLDEFIDTERLPGLPRMALALSPWRLYQAPDLPRGVRLRRALEELGPSFIKLGQLMSTRADLFPPEYIEEFTKLQDQVPPVPFSEIKAVIQEELQGSLEEVFYTSNCPRELVRELEHYGKAGGVKVSMFEGDSGNLGQLCGKPFKIAILGIEK